MQVKTNLNLTEFNSYRVRAKCRKAYFPENEEDFVEIFTNSNPQEVVVLGGGYNVILSKEYYDRDFVLIGESFSRIEIQGSIIACEAGVATRTLSEFALENCLSGVEIFYDIPSSIGGAVVMNAGASGEEIKDILLKVRYLDLEDMKIKEIKNDQIDFEYRNSFFQRNTDKIVLKVWIALQESNLELIRNKMLTIRDARHAKQPKDFPNAGSVFKRPKGYYVGEMIDKLDLKGLTVGGAKVSEKHGGFIINHNNASGEDIISLIKTIKEKVQVAFGVNLEIEQRII